MQGVARVSVDGSSLVEVLVSLLLLALGLLGASILQLSSLRARHESALLSAGAQLAAGMAERMRANSVLMNGPDGGNPYLNVDYAAADGGAPEAGGAPDCYGACDAAQLAQFDIAEWQQQLQSALPGARLRICRDLAAWDPGAEGLHWACSGGKGAPVVIKLGWRTRLPGGSPAVDAASESLPRLAFQLGGGGA